MDLAPLRIPHISISLAPPEEPLVEPYSPFSSTRSVSCDEDTFRPQHLTPPPTHTKFAKQLSPLRPLDDITAKGLERKRFEALLQASKDRNSAVGAKKACDLRKEIALKAHKNKQAERRALFLSKVLAPPSPTATLTPKTPPDSPAIFHYSLPSPGLVSPLALFESLSENTSYDALSYGREPWVEQVDFRVPECTKPTQAVRRGRVPTIRAGNDFGKPLPSLDQISARLNGHGQTRLQASKGDAAGRPARLPAFLTPRTSALPERTMPVGVGRLSMPLRAPKPKSEPLGISPPESPNLQVTTLIVPRSATMSPTELSEFNLHALDSRERRAHDMLSTLRRRTLSSEHATVGLNAEGSDDRRTKWKRRSAPADLLPLHRRAGFEHPVLALPGAF